jgi:signal transduction histidine kinase
LGLGIGVDPVSVNLGELFADALEQLRTSHPDQQIEFGVTGDLRGIWDPHRLHQLFDNLVGNALKYGSRDAPVRVVVVGAPNEVECRVHNRGPAIDKLTLNHLFDPLVQGDEARRLSGSHGSLGLGLYIARQIALAHGGDINARSDDSETVFTVRLPRLSVKAIPSA